MPSYKSLRPFVWVRFPGITKDVVFHSTKGYDERFSYLTDFQFEFGTGTAEASFTLLDHDYKITEALGKSSLPKQKDKVEQDGGIDIKDQKTKLGAIWQFGWAETETSENPWSNHPINKDIPSKTEVFSGIITDISLSISEGIYQYTFKVGGPSYATYHCFLPDKNGKGTEKKVIGENAYELVNTIAERVQIKVTWQKDAEEYAKKVKIEEEFNIGHKPIGYCINRILGQMARPPKSEKRAFRVLENMIGVDGGGIEIYVLMVDLSRPKSKKEIVRTYNLALDRNNLVLDFSPTIDKLQSRGGKVAAQSSRPDGLYSIMSSSADGKIKPNVAMSNSAQTDVEVDRASPRRPVVECRGISKQIQDVRLALAGITAELTVVGDPGLQFLAKPTPGWAQSNGRCVHVIFQKYPYITGSFGALKWEGTGVADVSLSGDYFITRVSHKMGTSQPYTTTLSLRKTGDDEEKSYSYTDVDSGTGGKTKEN